MLKWLMGIGIAVLGAGAVVGQYQHIGIGLGILGVGVILTSYSMVRTSKKQIATQS